MPDPTTIDTLVRRLDSALTRIDAMGADALEARTEHHRLTTLLAAAQKRAEEAEAKVKEADAWETQARDAAEADHAQVCAERDRLRAEIAAQQPAAVDERIVACIEKVRAYYPRHLYPAVETNEPRTRGLQDMIAALRALDGVDLTAARPPVTGPRFERVGVARPDPSTDGSASLPLEEDMLRKIRADRDAAQALNAKSNHEFSLAWRELAGTAYAADGDTPLHLKVRCILADLNALRAAAQRAASVDARVVAVIEAAREVDKFGPDPHIALRNLEDALRALEGVDLTAQPDDLARKACEACIAVHHYGLDTMKQCLEVGTALAARAKGVDRG